ncbi:MAG TPA: bifunctional UDP-sugar hydrolase/5'-nucleotidase [Verrucomicrobiae bacterium]|nr:bifunctional UDP-sugar hydrolase/5'-nucleotidase [Verrucomicrobiae bacterium]
MRLIAISLVFLFAVVDAFPREVALTILCTCDLHGHVLPTEDYEGQTNLGGIARCATVIRQVRSHEKNVLLLDVGDTLQGTALSYWSDGQVMVICLNQLHYDAWAWGNHEFDWGLEKLAACAEQAEMPVLNANVRVSEHDRNPLSLQIAARLKPYILREMDGVKIGIIGLNTPGIPTWSRPRLIDGLEFLDSLETLRKIVPEVRHAGAQVLVLICHQGYREAGDDPANQINAIARNFPELDVIIGAHTHRNYPEFKVGQSLYCQADHYGIHLGRIDLVFDTEKGLIVKRQSNTFLMDEHIPLDREILNLAGREIDRSEKRLSTVIGQAAGDFGTRAGPRKETPIHDLIFNAIVEALSKQGTKVDAVVHGLFERRATLKRGPLTVRDIWRIVPYENTLGVVQLTPAELRDVLEEDLDAYNNSSFRGIWGLKWTFNPDANKGDRTISLLHDDGSALIATQRLAVAFNSYDLASGGLRWKRLRDLVNRPETKLAEYNIQVREAVINYIRNRGTVAPSVGDWWKAETRSARSVSQASRSR